MTPGKEAELWNEFPVFDRNHERFKTGFNCEDGWFTLLQGLGRQLTMTNIARKKEIKVVGVKEKTGALIIDVEPSDPKDYFVKGILNRLYEESLSICERCGVPKEPNKDHCKLMNPSHKLCEG